MLFVVVILIKYFIKIEKIKLDKQIHLNRFAEANGFSYTLEENNPIENGIIFGLGEKRKKYDVLKNNKEKFEVANYTYTLMGKRSEIKKIGYILIKLPRNLPHVMLDSRRTSSMFGSLLNHSPSSLTSFEGYQKLSLEGNFDSHFTLYSPRDYEIDALYIFTPDIMEMFINTLSNFDIEIVDDNFYVYSNSEFDLNNQEYLENVLTIVNTVLKKIVSRTDYYSDERVGNRASNVVADSGRRLKTRSHLSIAIAVIVIVTIIVLFLQILSFWHLWN